MRFSMFPTFEEIDNDNCTYRQVRLDNNFTRIEQNPLRVQLGGGFVYYPFVKKIQIYRTRSLRTRKYFKVTLYNGCRTFPYSAKGWNQAIRYIKDEARNVRIIAEHILNEEAII